MNQDGNAYAHGEFGFTHHTYVYIFNAARRFYWIAAHAEARGLREGFCDWTKVGDSPEENAIASLQGGHGYLCMSALVFSAMAVEAYANHIAFELKPTWWAKDERSLSTERKLRKLAEEYAVALDFGRRPMQNFSNLFRLRDTLVHGKTATAVDSRSVESFDQPQLEWQKSLTVSDANAAVEAASDIIAHLALAFLNQRHPFLVMGTGAGSISISSANLPKPAK